MSLESKVTRVSNRGATLRAVVPEGLIAFLGLEVGDKVVWRMEFVGNERVAIVTKKKKDSVLRVDAQP